MPRIIIIGNSSAGFSCCQKLLEQPGNEITVITEEGFPAYNRALLIDYLAGRVKESQLFLCTEQFYQDHGVRFLQGAKVARIDIKKKAVVTKDNTKHFYDYLVIASGERVIIPDVPGKSKDGVFALYALKDVKEIRQRLLLGNVFCVIGTPDISLRLCEAIASCGKEAKVLSAAKPEASALPEKTEWFEGVGLLEIIGEGSELKAVKLSNGKVVGVDSVIFTGASMPATEFLRETGIFLEGGYVTVSQDMRTDNDFILACGCVCRSRGEIAEEKDWARSGREGTIAATTLLSVIEKEKVLCQ